MRSIICYGDSNTWGADPSGAGRFAHDVRWPGVLRLRLNEQALIHEEGLGGRATVFDDPLEPGRNGLAYLLPCLRSHQPIDLLIMMLGTNDCKARFNATASDIASGAERLIKAAQQTETGVGGFAPRILLIAPPPFAPLAGLPFEEMFTGGEAKAARLGKLYAQIAANCGVDFMDAGQVITSSARDGIHFEAEQHQRLGEAIAIKVRELLTLN